MSVCCCKLAIGAMLHGFCGGHFGRDSYRDKRVEAVGADWVVAREASSSKALFYSGPLEFLLPYLVEPEEEEAE